MATKPPHPSAIRSLYRSFLRELPPRTLLSSEPKPLHQRLRSHFEPSSPLSPSIKASSPSSSSSSSAPPPPLSSTTTTTLSPQQQHKAVAHAEQYVAYFRAQRTYAALLERYNPGMGMDEETRVRLTARRVGMDLPIEYGGKVE